jgi:hypothetical protein
LTRQQVSGFATGQRILIASSSTYTLLRLLYFLLPLNTALLDQAVASDASIRLPEDTLIVLYFSKSWRYDEGAAQLDNGTTRIPIVPVFIGGDLSIYRTRRAQP